MAQPARNDWKVDVPLTNISIAYAQAMSNFIAGKVFPVLSVDSKSDKYYTYTKNDWFRDEAELRPPQTQSAGSGYGMSTDTYYCDKFAFHKDIDNDDLEEQGNVLDFLSDATEFVTQRIMLRKEIQFVTDYFTTSVWGTDVTPSNLWSDYAASDPITDIETGKETVLSNTGFEPNTFVLGYQVWRRLRHHPDIIDRFKYVSAESVGTEMLANLFGVERVLVAKAVKATNVEGGTAAYSFTHGKHALLCYVSPRPSLRTPSAGYMFEWSGLNTVMDKAVRLRSFSIPELDVTRVEGEVAFDCKVTGSDLGYFFNGAVS